jgi:D-xylose 1-dehydrogenase (NADP+, D-xylono-1,5-lactone-forming)
VVECTAMTTPLRWGILGGSSRIYRNALLPLFDASPRHEVVAEASRSGADESPYAELLARTDVDAVYIPLPNHLHASWMIRAVEAGKHVLCEKPLTLSLADTEAVFTAAAANDRHVVEAYMWPHQTRAQRVLELVADGALGTPVFLRSAFSFPLTDPTNHRNDLRGDGAMFDIGIYCFGPAMLIAQRDPSAMSAFAIRNEHTVDRSMSGIIDWGAGFISTFEVSFDAPVRRTLEVTGSTGILTLPNYAVSGPEGPSIIEIQRLDNSIEQIDVIGNNGYQGMIDQFADVVAGLAPPTFGVSESLRLARIQAELQRLTGR